MGKKRECGSAGCGVLTGKKREILRDVSRFLPGYNGIVQTFAMGIRRDYGSLPIRDLMDYITYAIMTLNQCIK